MNRAQDLGFQAAGSAADAAAAVVQLGELHWDGGDADSALAAFRTALVVLTEHRLRTQQAAAVLHWMARCHLKLGRPADAKRDLQQATGILSAIMPDDASALDDVKDTQAALHLEQKQHKRAARTLAGLADRPRPAVPDGAGLRRLTMLFAAHCGLSAWPEAASVMDRVAAEAAALAAQLHNAGAPRETAAECVLHRRHGLSTGSVSRLGLQQKNDTSHTAKHSSPYNPRRNHPGRQRMSAAANASARVQGARSAARG